MLYISAFTFGGGFVIVTLMRRRFVEELKWLTEEEMLDITALAQSAPGAIAVNAAILAGRAIAGPAGVVAAVLGTIVPPITLLSIISLFYSAFASNPYVAAALSGMSAGVAAVICDVTVNLATAVLRRHSALEICIMALAFIAAYLLRLNAALIILMAAVLGTGRLLAERRREAK